MKSSEPEAFRALFREHHPRIRRYFAARAPASQVDDLAAETFLVAWRRFGDIPPQPLPWLLNVAAKVHANQRRKTDRAQALVERLARVGRLDARTPRSRSSVARSNSRCCTRSPGCAEATAS